MIAKNQQCEGSDRDPRRHRRHTARTPPGRSLTSLPPTETIAWHLLVGVVTRCCPALLALSSQRRRSLALELGWVRGVLRIHGRRENKTHLQHQEEAVEIKTPNCSQPSDILQITSSTAMTEAEERPRARGAVTEAASGQDAAC
ncbi:uncharacterized protein LOC119594799 [Penaeus monodon]|uniref:uncharacterized protein LOC119594799 n=1 Tax=Penaeus monodon TaxID=6687 RepID=UPI0018A6FF62|nr:uncharacterized protein LOC119594799 [Penaeus monodon]